MSVRIVPIAEEHLDQLFEVFSAVAAEKQFLAWIEPVKRDSFEFYKTLLATDCSAFVACEGDRVLGHCDVHQARGDAQAHVGEIGLYLTKDVRNRGIGRQLMTASTNSAFERGLTRIKLSVRTDNHVAIALYERLGFEIEGTGRNAYLVDGQYYDSYTMAYFKQHDV